MKILNLITSIIAIVLSIIAICISFNAFLLSDTAYLGWIVSVLSTLVVILIGWDIYKVVDVNRKLDESAKENKEWIDKLKNKYANLDFIGSEKNISLYEMVITKQIVYVAVSQNQVFSIKSVSVPDSAFVIIVTALEKAVIALPSAGKYINMDNVCYALEKGDVLEINVFYSSADEKYHLKVVGK